MDTRWLLANSSIVIMWITFFVWLRMPTPRQYVYRLLGYTIIAGLAVESIGLLTVKFGISNIVFYTTYQLIESGLVLAMTVTLLRRWRGAALICFMLIVLMIGLELGYAGNVQSSIPITTVFIAMALTGFVLGVLWQLARTSNTPLHRVPEFVLFMGLLVYFGAMSPLIATVYYIHGSEPQLAGKLFSIMPILCIIRYLLTSLACTMHARNEVLLRKDRSAP